jgi:hypothetical protein
MNVCAGRISQSQTLGIAGGALINLKLVSEQDAIAILNQSKKSEL